MSPFHRIILSLAGTLLWLCSCSTNHQMTAENPPVVTIDTTVAGLNVYYPHFTRIDLVCGTMPSTQDGNIVFCAEAAFTHELLNTFAHTNIDGDHVSGGMRYTGAGCKDNSGAFAFYDGKWEFVRGDYNAMLDRAEQGGGMGFGQAIIIYDGESVRPLWRSGVNEYRALCEKDGHLCIVDSDKAVSYDEFVALLEAFAPRFALYLDMGAGWNHSWLRDASGAIHEIHPPAPKSKFCTNWITFYK